MNFRIAIIKCFMLYFVFKGRAKRAEFWWFFLFLMILGVMTSIIDSTLGTQIVTNDMGTITEVDDQKTGIFSTVVQLITFIPGLAVGARRLHDTNRSGWWQLLWIVILIGWIPLLIFFASPSKNDDNLNYNKFGPEEE
tara:strand:+ start:129 stop:542 length:414 start_codon:yes stop_codon:yes gene_type:complete